MRSKEWKPHRGPAEPGRRGAGGVGRVEIRKVSLSGVLNGNLVRPRVGRGRGGEGGRRGRGGGIHVHHIITWAEITRGCSARYGKQKSARHIYILWS